MRDKTKMDKDQDTNSSDPSTSVLQQQSSSDRSVELSRDALIHVFETVCSNAPLPNVLNLRLVNRLANETVTRAAIKRMNSLKIEIGEPVRFKIVGLKRKELPVPEPLIYIQDLRFKHSNAFIFLDYLLRNMQKLSCLTIHVQSTDNLTILDQLLDQVLAAECVKLSELHIRRRKGGQKIGKAIELVKRHAATLKVVKGLGITEAADSFSNKMNLSHLSLMTFDLGLASEDSLYDYLLELATSGACFSHLSYSSFVGLDPTDDVVQSFLEKCGVESLRMTMLRGPLVPHDADFIFGKVRGVKSLQLGEVVDRPAHYNRLIVYEPLFKKCFPYVEQVHFFQQWN